MYEQARRARERVLHKVEQLKDNGYISMEEYLKIENVLGK